MKLYIPFSMIIDIDVGVIKLIEKLDGLSEYPVNKLKSFLLKRTDINPVPEYRKLRKVEKDDNVYDIIMTKYYSTVLKLSGFTDILSFVINTYQLGLNNQVSITIGCDNEDEIKYFKLITSKLNYNFRTELNNNLNLKDFDYIMMKQLDEYQVEYLHDNDITGKRLYVADYKFNTIVDEESNTVIVDPTLHLPLESDGNILSLISIYNKK